MAVKNNQQMSDEAKAAKKEVLPDTEEVEEDEPKAVEFRQNFPFQEVTTGEILRTYIYPNNQQIPVPNVRFVSKRPDGGWRLISQNNLTQGVMIEPGYISVIYQGPNGKPFEFTE